MDAKATTFRIDPAVMAGLSKLSKVLDQSLNRLANEAIKEFVAKRILEVEADLESTLEDLRAYRKSDPDFANSIAELVRSEASAKGDPAEGVVTTDIGPAQAKVRGLLNE
jgi:predicted transcriptional regulator